MALMVEDGSGLAGAESYALVARCSAYATARGLSFPTADSAACEAALRRATLWLDATYASRFLGVRKQARLQALEWPRVGATDREGYAVSSDSVPVEIVDATCEAAIRELATPNSLAPDLDRAAKKLKAGSVEVEYMGGELNKSFQAVDMALARLLGAVAAPGTVRTGPAVRG